jgi:hypothetical protein
MKPHVVTYRYVGKEGWVFTGTSPAQSIVSGDTIEQIKEKFTERMKPNRVIIENVSELHE